MKVSSVNHHPPPWILALLRQLADDPVISLERRDPPTHALVRAVYVGAEHEAIVEVELIDAPPPRTAPVFGGFFEVVAFDAPSEGPERPWFVFERELSFEHNVARMTAAARDHVLCTGRRESPPMWVDEVPDPVGPRSFEDMDLTQRRPSQPPPASGPPAASPGRAAGPSSQRQPGTAPSSHRAPPRRRQAPPEPPPPMPPPGVFGTPHPGPAAATPPARSPGSVPPPPNPARRSSSIPPPPRIPQPPMMSAGVPPNRPDALGLPPPPPPPPPPPFGEDEA